VREGRAFPLAAARELEAAGVKLDVEDGGLFPGRAIKSADERRALAQSQRAEVAGMRAAFALIASSRIGRGGWLMEGGRRLTSERVRAEIRRVLCAHACGTRDIIVAGGRQAVDPHEAGQGALRAHESIVIDIFPRHLEHGYWGDITRTVVRGTPSPELAAMEAAVRAAHAAALRLVRAGAEAGAVHEAAASEIARRGFRNATVDGRPEGFVHGTGHGVGLDIHEPPWVTPRGGRLRAGHVITIEPGLYYAAVGGVRIEDTVCVEKGGYRLLASCPKPFVL
jgi:Xaa-Pro aminopeptidase